MFIIISLLTIVNRWITRRSVYQFYIAADSGRRTVLAISEAARFKPVVPSEAIPEYEIRRCPCR